MTSFADPSTAGTIQNVNRLKTSASWPNYGVGAQYLNMPGLKAGRDIKKRFQADSAAEYLPYTEDAGLLDMIRATGQSTLANNYFQTPGYQLLFGSEFADMDPRLQPEERFLQSPGYQYAVDQAMRQVNRGSAARGLLESGRTQRDLLNTAQGMALQDYYNWWDRLSGNYENYQNRLAQVAGMGSSLSGANAALNTGQAQSAASANGGGNIASLYANQGATGIGAYLNTGAAMSSNLMNAANINAQTAAANAQSQASMVGSAASLLGGFF